MLKTTIYILLLFKVQITQSAFAAGEFENTLKPTPPQTKTAEDTQSQVVPQAGAQGASMGAIANPTQSKLDPLAVQQVNQNQQNANMISAHINNLYQNNEITKKQRDELSMAMALQATKSFQQAAGGKGSSSSPASKSAQKPASVQPSIPAENPSQAMAVSPAPIDEKLITLKLDPEMPKSVYASPEEQILPKLNTQDLDLPTSSQNSVRSTKVSSDAAPMNLGFVDKDIRPDSRVSDSVSNPQSINQPVAMIGASPSNAVPEAISNQSTPPKNLIDTLLEKLISRKSQKIASTQNSAKDSNEVGGDKLPVGLQATPRVQGGVSRAINGLENLMRRAKDLVRSYSQGTSEAEIEKVSDNSQVSRELNEEKEALDGFLGVLLVSSVFILFLIIRRKQKNF